MFFFFFFERMKPRNVVIQRKGRKATFSLIRDEILNFAVSILGAVAAPHSSAAFIKTEKKRLCDERP